MFESIQFGGSRRKRCLDGICNSRNIGSQPQRQRLLQQLHLQPSAPVVIEASRFRSSRSSASPSSQIKVILRDDGCDLVRDHDGDSRFSAVLWRPGAFQNMLSILLQVFMIFAVIIVLVYLWLPLVFTEGSAFIGKFDRDVGWYFDPVESELYKLSPHL